MNQKIIGLPVIVSTNYRIVIDKNIRMRYEIAENDTILMKIQKSYLHIYPKKSAIAGAEMKDISIGRFNLPFDWAKGNRIRIGDYVYIVGTTHGFLICPAH